MESGHRHLLCDICLFVCLDMFLFGFAADNATKMFSLLRAYEPHGPLVRGHGKGMRKQIRLDWGPAWSHLTVAPFTSPSR